MATTQALSLPCSGVPAKPSFLHCLSVLFPSPLLAAVAKTVCLAYHMQDCCWLRFHNEPTHPYTNDTS